jgi:hypothetical protein
VDAAAVGISKSRNHSGGLWQFMLLEIKSRNSSQEGLCRLTASARVLPA